MPGGLNPEVTMLSLSQRVRGSLCNIAGLKVEDFIDVTKPGLSVRVTDPSLSQSVTLTPSEAVMTR